MANFFRSVLSSARAILQNKTATPTTSVQVITPDSGYDGLAQVTVNAVNLQSKTTTMTPPSPSSWSATTTKLGTVTPDSGYTGLSQVDISIPMIPDNSTLSLQSSGSDYDTYTTGRGGYVFSNSYLRVPKSGGSETTLWTNSSPTSSFSNQDISLNQSIDNFKYIAIYTRASTSYSTETVSIFSVSFVKTTDTTRGWEHPKMTVGCTPSTYGYCARYFGYVSNTSIRAYSIIRVVDDGSVSQPTTIHIPTKITGIK